MNLPISMSSLYQRVRRVMPEAEWLSNIGQALEGNQHEVTVDPAVAEGARLAVERMLAI